MHGVKRSLHRFSGKLHTFVFAVHVSARLQKVIIEKWSRPLHLKVMLECWEIQINDCFIRVFWYKVMLTTASIKAIDNFLYFSESVIFVEERSLPIRYNNIVTVHSYWRYVTCHSSNICAYYALSKIC